MNEITTTRTNLLIDPEMHIWHGEVAAYLFLGGLVAGIMILSGLWLLRGTDREPSRHLALLPWAAPVLLSLGMLFLWLDLENRLNAFRFYLVFKPGSPMSWGAWILLAIYPASGLLAWLTTPADLRRGILKRIRRRFPRLAAGLRSLYHWTRVRSRQVAWANVVAGVALGVYTGLLLGTMAARPLWNSAILGPLFLTSGLSTGAAYMLLHSLSDRERIFLGRMDMGLIAVELGLVAIWLLSLTTGGATSRAAAGMVLGGPYTAAFWTLVIALGLVAPLWAEWLEHRHRRVPGRLAAGLVLMGGLALRWIVVFAGQHGGLAELALH